MSRKRVSEGGQLNKDNFDREDEDEDEPSSGGQDGSGFQKADPATLAKRRIIRVKR